MFFSPVVGVTVGNYFSVFRFFCVLKILEVLWGGSVITEQILALVLN